MYGRMLLMATFINNFHRCMTHIRSLNSEFNKNVSDVPVYVSRIKTYTTRVMKGIA